MRVYVILIACLALSFVKLPFTIEAHAQASQSHDKSVHKLMELSCGVDLIKRDDARKAVIRLIGDIYPSPDDQGTIDRGISASELMARAQVSQCLKRQMRVMVEQYQQSDTFHLNPREHVIFHDLQWMNVNILTQMHEQLMLQDSRTLFSPEMVPVIQAINRPIPFDKIAQALDIHPDLLPVIEQLAFYIHHDLPADAIEADITKMATQVATWRDPELVAFGALTLMRMIGRNLFHLTDQGKKERLAILLQRQADLSEGNATADSDNWQVSAAQKIQKSIASLQANTPPITAGGLAYTIGETFINLGITDAEAILRQAYEQARAETVEGYLFKGMHLKEGDMILNADAKGLGQFFQALIQIPAMYSHMSLIAAQPMDDNWTAYYRVEIQNDLQINTVAENLGNNILLRFDHALDPYFTHNAIARMLGNEPKFDASFNPQQRGHTTDMSLYCPEMIHHVFTTGFGLWESQESPFPMGGEPLPEQSPVFQANAALLNVDATASFFVPDRLLHHPKVTIIDLHSASTAELLDHPQRSYMEQRLSLLYFKTLKQQTRQFPIRPLSMAEKVKLWGIIRLIEQATDIDFNHIDFANKNTQLFFFKIFMLNQELQKIADNAEWPRSAQPLSRQERQIMRQTYEQDVLPKANQFFLQE